MIYFYQVEEEHAAEVADHLCQKYIGRFPVPTNNSRKGTVSGYIVNPDSEDLDFLMLKTGMKILLKTQ